MFIYGAIVQLSCTHVASLGLVLKVFSIPSLVLNSCTDSSKWLFTPSTSVDELYIPPSTSVDELYLPPSTSVDDTPSIIHGQCIYCKFL